MRTPDKVKAKTWRTKHPDAVVKSNKARFRGMVLADPSRYLWYKAKTRARDQKAPFDITPEDLPVPEVCPVLGIPLVHGDGKWHDGSPTVDRKIPTLGYLRGNVQVISWRANDLKKNGTLDEFRRIVAYLEAGGSGE